MSLFETSCIAMTSKKKPTPSPQTVAPGYMHTIISVIPAMTPDQKKMLNALGAFLL